MSSLGYFQRTEPRCHRPPGVQSAQGLGLSLHIVRNVVLKNIHLKDGSTINLRQFKESAVAGPKKNGLLQEWSVLPELVGKGMGFKPVGQGSNHYKNPTKRATPRVRTPQ